MDRTQLLLLLIQQARTNGFAFRTWYCAHTARPWVSRSDALQWLSQGSRAQMLFFSHPFAQAFFRSGQRVRYLQPAVTYSRVAADGSSRQIFRRAHARQSNRENVWLYHLREMAAVEDPQEYLKRFLLLRETLAEMHAANAEPHSSEAEPNYDTELLVAQ